jgi:hypothetical protein
MASHRGGMLYLVLALCSPVLSLGLYNGTPGGVPTSFDCKARALAWEYGKHLAPHRGEFKSLFDALQLGGCSLPTPPTENDSWSPPHLLSDEATRNNRTDTVWIYVDAERGDDRNHDRVSVLAPLQTLQAALELSRTIVAQAAPGLTPARRIVVRGKHHLATPLHLTSEDSGLHFQNADGEHATLTGAKTLSGLVWKPYRPPHHKAPQEDSFLVDANNVYGVAKAGGKGDPPGLTFLGVLQTARLCQSECNVSTTCLSWTWHPDTAAMGKYRLNCFGRTTDYWDPHSQPGSGIVSGQLRPAPSPAAHSENGWVADVSKVLPIGSEVYGPLLLAHASFICTESLLFATVQHWCGFWL